MSKPGIQFFTLLPVGCLAASSVVPVMTALRKNYRGALLHSEADADVLEKKMVLVAIFPDRKGPALSNTSEGSKGYRRLAEDDPSGPMWAWSAHRFAITDQGPIDAGCASRIAGAIAHEVESIIQEERNKLAGQRRGESSSGAQQMYT